MRRGSKEAVAATTADGDESSSNYGELLRTRASVLKQANLVEDESLLVSHDDTKAVERPEQHPHNTRPGSVAIPGPDASECSDSESRNVLVEAVLAQSLDEVERARIVEETKQKMTAQTVQADIVLSSTSNNANKKKILVATGLAVIAIIVALVVVLTVVVFANDNDTGNDSMSGDAPAEIVDQVVSCDDCGVYLEPTMGLRGTPNDGDYAELVQTIVNFWNEALVDQFAEIANVEFQEIAASLDFGIIGPAVIVAFEDLELSYRGPTNAISQKDLFDLLQDSVWNLPAYIRETDSASIFYAVTSVIFARIVPAPPTPPPTP